MNLEKIGLFAIMIIAAVLLVSSVKTGKIAGIGEGIKYTGIMCYNVQRGELSKSLGHLDMLDTCRHNTYTEWGQNVTRDLLMATGGGAVGYISVGNGSGAGPPDNNLSSQINECGISWNDAATLSVQEVSFGNFSAQSSFSITCNVPKVNTTGIFNTTTGGAAQMFAADNFTTAVTNLASGDTLTVTWYIWSS